MLLRHGCAIILGISKGKLGIFMHEFIIIDFNDIPTEIKYCLIESSYVIGRCDISDKFIVNNYKVLSKLKNVFTE